MFAREDLIREAQAMDPLPASSARLTQILMEEDWSLNEVAKTVALDAALTGRILQYANSAACAGQEVITAVPTAVMRMGPGMVISIALGDGLKEQVDNSNPAETAIWRHSVASALAIVIMHKNGLKGPDGSFTAALVHDVGKLVIGRKLRRMGAVLTSANPDEPWMDEAEQLGIDHAELSGSIVRSWGLPAEIADAVAHHHGPHLLEDGPAKKIAQFVAAADAIAHKIDEEEPFSNPLITAHLGLSPQDQDKIRNATRTLLESVMKLYT